MLRVSITERTDGGAVLKGVRGPLPDDALFVETVVATLDTERANGSRWLAAEFNDDRHRDGSLCQSNRVKICAHHSPPPDMRVLKTWILSAIVAGAIIGLLAVTKAVTADDATQITLMTFGAIVILAGSHFAWDMLRGRTDARDRTDKPVP